MSEANNKNQPPAMSPYLLSILLVLLGLWCVYDGWFNADPKMLRHQDFNRFMSVVFLGWSVFDIVQTLRMKNTKAAKAKNDQSEIKDDSES